VTDSPLLDSLLAVPTAPPVAPRPAQGPTQQLEVKGDVAEATVGLAGAPSRDELDGRARDLLERNDLDPAEWQVVGFRTSEWTMANGVEGVSARFSFARVGTAAAGRESLPIDEIVERVRLAGPLTSPGRGQYGLVVALGDMQYGKVDGDGVEGTVERTFQGLSRAAAALDELRERFPVGHVHIGFLGDHIEGFVPQGGANAWRTRLTLNEQIRLTRLTMLHAMEQFAPRAARLSMVAVPGNHGEPQRFAGKGVTRYDDSHDTEALVAVREAAAMNARAYGHVEFYVPDTDEMTVTLDVAGTRIGHAHGHQWRPGKHFDWWEGQAFGGSPLRDADLLMAGHLHHFHVDTKGPRMFLQPPALESESTWWRHATGDSGHPGIVVAITRDGLTSPIEVIR